MQRREFIKLGALGVAALVHETAAAGDDAPSFKIGMAATTWLTAVPSTASYWNAVKDIAALQIGATEADNGEAKLDSAYGKNPAIFRQKSRAAGVYLPGVFQALPLHDSGKMPQMRAKTTSVSRFLKAAGAQYIALGWDVPSTPNGTAYQRTPDDVKHAIIAMNEVGRVAQGHGITIAFHAERDIPKEIILEVLDKTDPKYVHFCPDVGHLTATGLDPVQVVKKYSSRVAASHWKDFDPKLPGPTYLGPSATGDFVELGKGVVDFKALADLYHEIGFTGWVMLELDRTRYPSIQASAQAMKDYVTQTLKLRMYPRGR